VWAIAALNQVGGWAHDRWMAIEHRLPLSTEIAADWRISGERSIVFCLIAHNRGCRSWQFGHGNYDGNYDGNCG
jgi:hypothetical protein